MTIPHVIVEYTPHYPSSDTPPDGIVKAYCQNLYEIALSEAHNPPAPKYQWRIGAMLVITQLRVYVKNQKITLDIVYDDVTYPVAADGTLNWWGAIPDYNLDLLGELL